MKKNRNKKIRNYLIGFLLLTVMFATPIMNTKAETTANEDSQTDITLYWQVIDKKVLCNATFDGKEIEKYGDKDYSIAIQKELKRINSEFYQTCISTPNSSFYKEYFVDNKEDTPSIKWNVVPGAKETGCAEARFNSYKLLASTYCQPSKDSEQESYEEIKKNCEEQCKNYDYSCRPTWENAATGCIDYNPYCDTHKDKCTTILNHENDDVTCQECFTNCEKIAGYTSKRSCKEECTKKYDGYEKCPAITDNLESTCESKAENECHKTYRQSCAYDKDRDEYKNEHNGVSDGKCDLSAYDNCVAEAKTTCKALDPTIVLGKLTCDDLTEITNLAKRTYYIALVVLIVLFIVLTMLDYMKAVTSGDQDIMKKANKHLVTRTIILAIFILLPILISLVMKLFLKDIDSCLNFNNNNK